MKVITINWQQAATEFVVIVFGVLVALAVDEWRDEREDNVTELEYLARLRINIEADIENFSDHINILEEKANFLQTLADDSYQSAYDGDPIGLMQALRLSAFVALPDSVSTTFDELQNTGRLALIEDIDLRDALSSYYSGFEHISAIFVEATGDYRPLLYGAIPGSIFREWVLSGSISDVDGLLVGLKQLTAHPDSSTAINNEIAYASVMQFYLQQWRDQAETLRVLVEK